MQNEGEFCDVAIRVRGEISLPAHRFVLSSASPEIFNGDFEVVHLPHLSEEAARETLRVLYTGHSNLNKGALKEVKSTLKLIGIVNVKNAPKEHEIEVESFLNELYVKKIKVKKEAVWQHPRRIKQEVSYDIKKEFVQLPEVKVELEEVKAKPKARTTTEFFRLMLQELPSAKTASISSTSSNSSLSSRAFSPSTGAIQLEPSNRTRSEKEFVQGKAEFEEDEAPKVKTKAKTTTEFCHLMLQEAPSAKTASISSTSSSSSSSSSVFSLATIQLEPLIRTRLEKSKTFSSTFSCWICDEAPVIDFLNRFEASSRHLAVCYFNHGPPILHLDDCKCGKMSSLSAKSRFVHAAHIHGQLEAVLRNEAEEKNDAKILEVAEFYQTYFGLNSTNGTLEVNRRRLSCLVSNCNFVCESNSRKELSEHCALVHFRAHYVEDTYEGGKARIPKRPDLVNGELCSLCPSTEAGKKPRVIGNVDQLIVHLAIGHGKLRQAMTKRAGKKRSLTDYGDKYLEMRDLLFPANKRSK